MYPGQLALIRTFCAAWSSAAARVSPMTPCFAAVYAARPLMPMTPAPETYLFCCVKSPASYCSSVTFSSHSTLSMYSLRLGLTARSILRAVRGSKIRAFGCPARATERRCDRPSFTPGQTVLNASFTDCIPRDCRGIAPRGSSGGAPRHLVV
jgi:hypothetical protein